MSFQRLVQRNSTFYFRTRIPKDLRPFFDRAEVWKSLQTRCQKNAKMRSAKIIHETERTFLLMRSGLLSEQQIRQLAAEYMKKLLHGFEHHRDQGSSLYEFCLESPVDAMTFNAEGMLLEKLFPLSGRKTIEGRDEVVAYYRKKLKYLRDCLFTDNFDEDFRYKVKHIIEESGFPAELPPEEYFNPNEDAYFAKPPANFIKACRALLKAEIDAYEVEISRLNGDYNNPFDRSLAQHTHSTSTVQEDSAEPVFTLAALVQAHVKEALTAGQWNEKTQAENESIYRLILDLLGGERPVKEITHQDFLDLRDKMSRLPANLNKKPEYRDKTVQEVLEMSVQERISTTTLNKYLTRVSTLFKWALKHKYIAVNYAEGLTLAKKRKVEEEREAYTKADLQRMVAALPRQEKNPERFWIPLIGMYSGLRLNEICQLHIEDIREVDGIHCFDVNGKGDKKIKTISSERVVPIHPVLIQLGFLDYVSQQQEKGHGRVWPNLVKKRDGYAQDFGKYFQRFNRANVTTNPKRVFHSLRHTVADQLKQAGVQDILISEILGHATESITMTRYGKSYRPAVMLDAMQMLEHGVEVELKKFAER